MNNFPGKRNEHSHQQYQSYQPAQFRKHYRQRGIRASPFIITTSFLIMFVVIVILQSIFGK